MRYEACRYRIAKKEESSLTSSFRPGGIMINIKNAETDRLARALAAATGESLTEAVTRAIRERLERTTGQRRVRPLREEIERIQERVAQLKTLDPRTADEILGYDEDGLPT
jgi:antitoxin VapB